MPKVKPTEEIMQEEKTTPVVRSAKTEYIFAVGRRKESVARIRLYVQPQEGLERGQIVVNGLPAEEYFRGNRAEGFYTEPLRVTNTTGKFVITIKVAGGGKNGQVDAIILGIARALDKLDSDKYHSLLKKKNLLTRDARVRQRRKVGMGGKSRRKKQSPKR